MTTETQRAELDLSAYAKIILQRGGIVAVAIFIGISAAAVISLSTKPMYQATTLLLIEKERGSGVVFNNGAVIESSNLDYYQTQYRLLRSHSFLSKVYAKLRLIDTSDFSEQIGGVGKLAASLQIEPLPRSRLINVSIKAHDPHLAAKVADAICEEFVLQNLDNKLFISKDILGALSRNAPQDQRLFEALPSVVNNGLVQTLKADLVGKEGRFAILSRRYTEKHPELIRIKADVDATQARLKDETDKIILSMRTELSGQLQGNNMRVVDLAAVPQAPIAPRTKRNLMLGLLGGLATGVFLALFVDSLDQAIKTQEDVERYLGLPFLGTVPKVSAKVAQSAHYRLLLAPESSVTAESIRSIRTMVSFSEASAPLKRIVVTSSIQGEGKTYLASCLSVAFAMMGKKVLMIEGDLRRPNLGKIFGLRLEPGLTDFLAVQDQGSDLSALVQQTEVKGLDILVAGHRTPNPSELLSTPAMQVLLQWASHRYDRVIIDGAPILPVSDTLLWSKHADGILFVARSAVVQRKNAARVVQRLGETGKRIFGCVLTMVSLKNDGYGDYNYSYQEGASDSVDKTRIPPPVDGKKSVTT